MPPLILGVNKYSQSTACALLDGEGNVLFAMARERLTRKKYDGGDIAQLLRCALEQTGARLQDIGLIVENCHLFRIGDFERRLPFATGVHYCPATYLDEYNLAKARCPGLKVEITHHLAHAYGAFFASPFDEGVIVVMDGMGSLRADVEAPDSAGYAPESAAETAAGFAEFPGSVSEPSRWREAESAYLFSGREIKRLWKRWSPLRSPSLLYNYGFENMESLGAVYSRIASHIFGDWNACGKVMGLAGHGEPDPARPIMTGPLEDLCINWEYLDALVPARAWDETESADLNRTLAATIQSDLETVALDFLLRLRKKTGAKNLILTGGVALNSQLNARVAAESGFDNVFVPSAPGDDGVAFGCAAFGFCKETGARGKPRPVALTPYLGGEYDAERMRKTLREAKTRIAVSEPEDIALVTAGLIAEGKVVGWFQGRSEYGPRALGNRSILAHPGLPDMPDRLNVKVKRRERFRPFAPTVLAEEAERFFEESSPSTYMSFAVPVRPDKRGAVPAVTHVDGTARLQRLERRENPLYYDLIRHFEAITSLPLVLNTSFNTAGEAIVETPDDALWTFLDSDMDALAMGPFLVTKTPWPAGEERTRFSVQASPEALVETVAQATGELTKATIYFRGKGHDADALSLAVLDAISEPMPIPAVTEALAEEAAGGTVLAELERLFRIGVVELHERS